MLVLKNGAYGQRIANICQALELKHQVASFPDGSRVDPETVETLLGENSDVTHVAIVHSETSSGVFNPIKEIGQLVKSKLPGDILDNRGTNVSRNLS